MATVSLRTGESQESLLKRFRKEVMKERILPTVRKKRWFTPPSELRRLKKQKAIRKARQAQRRREGREELRVDAADLAAFGRCQSVDGPRRK